MKNKLIISLIFISFCISNVFSANQFPLREKYPDVKIITIDKLYNNFNDYIIIDVRSKYEFTTLHIKSARNIPLAKSYFVNALKNVRKISKKPLVFYCNGTTCAKSYKATQKAMQNGINNVYSYDFGIPGWSEKHPDKTTLLGKTPANPSKMINKAEFNAHLLPQKEFFAKVDKGGVAIDVRDKFQKTQAFPLDKKALKIPLNKPSKIFILGKQGKTLLIYDAVGKQLRWLQNHLKNDEIKK